MHSLNLDSHAKRKKAMFIKSLTAFTHLKIKSESCGRGASDKTSEKP